MFVVATTSTDRLFPLRVGVVPPVCRGARTGVPPPFASVRFTDQGGTVGLGDKARERRQAAELATWQAERDRVQAFIARAESFTGATNAEVPTLPLALTDGERALLVLPGVQL